MDTDVTRKNITEDGRSYYLGYNRGVLIKRNIINFVGYCRVSTDIQMNLGSSIDTQIQLLNNYCRNTHVEDGEYLEYRLVGIYIDDGISAKNVEERPGLMELKNHLQQLSTGRTRNKIGLITPDLSRLTRNSSDLNMLLSWMEVHAIRFKFIDNSIDPASHSGKMMLSVLGSFFEFERANSAFKTKMTMRIMSENGTLRCNPSYGWAIGLDEHGRHTKIPVEEEQAGYQEVLRLHRDNPHFTAVMIKDIMNDSEHICYRGPGRRYGLHTNHVYTEDELKTEWTGRWTIAIIEKIIEDYLFAELLETERGTTMANVFKKDDIVIQAIIEYLDSISYQPGNQLNVSLITRHLNSRKLFLKPLYRGYVLKMMIKGKIVDDDTKEEQQRLHEEVVEFAREVVQSGEVRTINELLDVMIQEEVPTIGRVKQWKYKTVWDLCRKNNIRI